MFHTSMYSIPSITTNFFQTEALCTLKTDSKIYLCNYCITNFIGFIAKFGVFVTVIESYLFSAAVFSILCSILSVFYYLRIIKLIFFEKSDDLINLYEFQSSFFYFIFMTFVLLLVFLFINPNLIYLIFLKISYNFS